MIPSEKYRIIQRLGKQQQRKFGEVFLVEDKITCESGTMKVVAKSGNELRELRLRAEAGFSFDHSQLPKTLYSFETETELVVVKNHFPGVPLDVFLKSVKSKQKPAVLLRLLTQLKPIFDELNRQYIVHLDIKPSNLIINGTAKQFELYLIDFGMAMRTNQMDHRGTLFPLGYAAPELLLNRLHLADQRTDLFALGIVLWQSFTGKLPLLHPNPSITTNLQLTHPLPDHDDIPKRYLSILKRLCAKYSFGVPPNQLPSETMDAYLKEAMDQRYTSLEEVISNWKAALEKKRWFGF
ncbi:MAG: protein kinase [Fluviicola sp.]|nr:protein kinase [Fluviicola sp.]